MDIIHILKQLMDRITFIITFFSNIVMEILKNIYLTNLKQQFLTLILAIKKC